ncbi:cation diffusion facilitator family transporter [Methanobacterium sp. MBAC-LM]|uniref:cation diffusion facilitator family transporter n=1 Tax=Methanobacterium sp. MBAC-LM TaxID=3412034 RepID=UPI003C73CD43
MQNASEREKIGKQASYVAIFGNIFLTIFNIIVGIFSGSTALVAEGFHTLSDVLTSVIAFIGFKIGMKPADEEHQYGHGRAEPIVGLIIVVFLVIVAYEIIYGAYAKIVLGEAVVPPSLIAAIMAAVGIGINYIMSNYLTQSGEKISSPALIADGKHQRVDIFSCITVLIGVVGSQFGIPILDTIVSVFIALIIINTAFRLARDNINTLMGKIPSKEVIEDIKKAALLSECVKGVHDVKINNMGPYASAELHIELNKDLKLEKSHKIAHEVERNIINNVESVRMVSVHTCPIEVVCKQNLEKNN